MDITWQLNNNKGSMKWRVAETKAGVASKAMSLSKLWELLMDREAWCTAIHGVTKSQRQLRAVLVIS